MSDVGDLSTPDEVIYGMAPEVSIARVHRLTRRLDMLSGILRGAQSQLDQVRMVLEQCNRDIGQMAHPVPDGHVHAPGCERGPDGWHTCVPIPEPDGEPL